MKLLRFGERGSERPALLDDHNHIRDLSGLVDDIDPAFLASSQFEELRKQDWGQLPRVEDAGRIGIPVVGTGKFIGVGLNYADHAQESGQEPPSEPILFMKATSAISGPYDDVVLPRNHSKTDWEAELGVIIGKEARYVPLQEAWDHVAGLCVVNDVSERKFQIESGGQWVKGKSCDTFGPIGPYLVTLDEVEDPGHLDVWLELNGERVQNGNTERMIFDVPFLVHYISQFMSLQPGDIISTGTPPGVGMGKKPPVWLKAGDVMRLGVEGLGIQEQTVVESA
jgi:2-keto-4-pentenoate hydratase/2-oxohepta-3-ene-1,7-dioic acid hydratase in catechol pathway